MSEYKEIVITLFESHYHLGVAALANSLVKSGFSGLLNVGYKGNLPPWTSFLNKKGVDIFHLSSDVDLRFELIESELHFGYYKPNFLSRMFVDYPQVDKVYYFDPDIVVNAKWDFFSTWVDSGIALCTDNSFPFVYRNHPWRTEWKKLGKKTSVHSDVDFYVNSGFVGICKNDVSLLDTWIYLTHEYRINGGDTTLFEKDAHRAFKGDQDLLNAAITIRPELTYSVIGQEGMGFIHPTYLMTHTVTMGEKPWRKNFITFTLKSGQKPDLTEKNFFNYCEYPIPVFPKGTLRFKRFSLKIATLLGRVIGIFLLFSGFNNVHQFCLSA
jgi:hypothetical protein